MDKHYSIRKPDKADLKAISDLIDLVFVDRHNDHTESTTSDFTPDFYEWKFFRNPIHPSCIRIAQDGHKLIGLVAATFRRINIGTTHLLCAELGDLCTHPEYRYQGVFARLATEVCKQVQEDGAQIVYVRPNDNSYPGLVKMGFERIFCLTPMVNILNIASIWARKLTSPSLFHLSLPLARLLQTAVFRNVPASIPPRLTLSEVSSFGDDADDLWKRVSRHFQVTIIRNQEYLNWRYVDNPRDYIIYAARHGTSLVGYIVMQCDAQDSAIKRGYIVDMLTARDHPALPQILIAKALDRFRQERVDVVSTWVIKSSEVARMFRISGFIPRRADLHFVIRPNEMKMSDLVPLRDPANWFFTMGDTDGV